MKLNYEKGHIPTKYELRVGEVAYNAVDGIQYTKLKDDSIVQIGGSSSDGKGGGIPDVGFDFYGTTAPAGALACNGQAVSRTTYAELFAAIGTTWGGGDGSTTFNLPIQEKDGLGLYNRGVGSINGPVGTYQDDVFKAHNHSTTAGSGEFVSHSSTGPINNREDALTGTTGDPIETRPRSLTVLKCIWYGEIY